VPSKIENISNALSLINLAIPAVASVIVTLRNGKKIDLKALLDDTDKRVNDVISKGEDFLKRG
jgi:hypothetical protein